MQRLYKDCGQTFGKGVVREERSRGCASKLMTRQNSKAGSPSGHAGMG